VKGLAKVEKTFPFNIFYGFTKQNVPLTISIMGTVDTYQTQRQILKTYPKKVQKREDHGDLSVKYLKKLYMLQLEYLRMVICPEASCMRGVEI